MRHWQHGAPRWLARTVVVGAKRLEAFLSVRETEGGSLAPKIVCGVAENRARSRWNSPNNEEGEEKRNGGGGKGRGLV